MCIGSLAVLIKAKEKGLIEDLKPILLQLLSFGRYFSTKLLNQVLNKVGETNIE